MKFSHLHNHTQYSLLDGASDIDKLFKKAAADKMPGMAITDHGNMFGVYDFVKASKKYVDDKGVPLVKPIIGCEFYMTEDRFQTKFSKENKDKRHHQLLLAKNHEGYKNLIKLCSIGFTEGLYSKWPRIDKTVLKEYSKGLIATTCCLGAIVPKTILQKGEDAAEKEFLWWKDVFGEDYYVELQRHGIPDQDICNKVLVRFAHKHNVKIIASNDSHYVEEEDSYSQDILLCINTGSLKSVPIKDDFSDNSEESRNTRFGFSLNEFYFKDTNQMAKIFKDLPQALDNTNEIVDKIELINITNDLLLPNFPTPPEFKDQFDYLSFLTHQGAKGRYLITTPEIESRIEFELGVIKKMGFPGYFLIVSDIIHWAKQNKVFVGTGRGSAAGSVVAYCIGITNIDPMKHNLLFERFLNPDRKSMPDIDTDFDDTGRGKVIQYIVDTYGKEQVAHIITHNKMAAKMSVKDVARVLELPLAESNELAKLIPELPGTSLRESLHLTSDEMAEKYKDKVQFQENIKELQNRYKGNDLAAKVLKEAEKLEGTIRNTGLHAAGIIIGPEPLTNIMPVCKHKDSELYMTQFEGKIIEEVGAIKIDILGLTNLTILRDSIEMVKENHGVEVDLETLPLTDEKTFQLYQKAETEGTFQFASDGMKAHLLNLKPDNIEDLIALNALFRPGPMEYIDDFIKRKFGIKQIEYDLPEMEEYLKETYGITVYQEQVMLLSQKLANFSRGDADKLRKAMGKKDKKTLDEMKEQFTDGCVANGHAKSKIEKIWKDWEAFAQYAFNKSHSTCYAYLAYQTAYFKANYPAEYMTALLNANRTNIDSISKYMRECRQMGLQVLGPDINESLSNFSVKKDGIIRFGMAGVKGVGEAAVKDIIEEREKNGKYTSFFDLVERLSSSSANKRTYESLCYAGAFDVFEEYHRAQYFHINKGESVTNLERIIRYGQLFQDNTLSNSNTLFGDAEMPKLNKPILENCTTWSLTEKLEFEKEVLGIFLTAHPLDDFSFEMKYYNIIETEQAKKIIEEFEQSNAEQTTSFRVAGYISQPAHLISRKGTNYCKFNLNDFSGSINLALFKDDYVNLGKFVTDNNKILVNITLNNRKLSEGFSLYTKVTSIILLENVKSSLSKRLNINMPLSQLNDEFYGLIKKYVERSGECELGLNIEDKESNQMVKLNTGYKKIKIDDELIEELAKFEHLNYNLISN